MPENLLTSRSDLDGALGQVLAQAKHQLRIFDGTLASFELASAERCALLQAFLANPRARLTIILQDPEPFRRHQPRLQELLRNHGHAFQLLQAPEDLGHLRDAMVLADNSHAVIYFHRDQPRGKHIVDDSEACRPYLNRFEAIVAEGCAPIGVAPLGL